MENSLCVFRMSVAFVSLNDRGRKQQQGNSNQTSWHFEIDSEKSTRGKESKSRPVSTTFIPYAAINEPMVLMSQGFNEASGGNPASFYTVQRIRFWNYSTGTSNRIYSAAGNGNNSGLRLPR